MIIEGHCNDCGSWFNAHWHEYPDLTTQDAILTPYCFKCKSINVTTTTDESDDLKCSAWEDKHGRIEDEETESNEEDKDNEEN